MSWGGGTDPDYHVVGEVLDRKVIYSDREEFYVGAREDLCTVLPTIEVIYSGPDSSLQGRLAQGYRLENGWVVILDGRAKLFHSDRWIEYKKGFDEEKS
jgi:hypothetical protein